VRPLFGWASAVLVISLSVACVYDLRFRRIPNVLVGLMLFLAILLALLGAGEVSLSQCLLGALVGLVVLLPLYVIRALGAGDVKLMSAIGAVLGVPGVIWAIVYTGMAGGVMGLAVLCWVDGWKQTAAKLAFFIRFREIAFLRPGPVESSQAAGPVRLPYALAMSAGVALYRFVGPPI